MRRPALVLFLLLATLASAQVPDDAAIRAILADRIDKQHLSVGIVVGVIEPAGRRVVGYGNVAKDDSRAPNGDTIFEIGSMTKVFTSLLLADMVRRNELKLDDPVVSLLPVGVKVPERAGKKITLADLASHTSGLPRLPSNMPRADPANPYADYTVEQLYDLLGSTVLTRDIGSKYEYSNLGAGLLGHALALHAKKDYETLVRTLIFQPLGMKSSAITLSTALAERMAKGYDAEMKPASNWDLPTLAGAGAIRSTANDLLNFLAANLGLTKSPLAEPMAAMLEGRRPTGSPGLEIGLAWHITTREGREFVWHNGGTGGYRTWIGFEKKSRTGVVVLSNAATTAGVDDIGRHLLDPTAPLMQAPKQRSEIAVDPKTLARYAGVYELSPAFSLTVTPDAGHLYVRATGQPRFEVFAESEKEFFYKAVDAQITFVTDESGEAASLVMHQNGANVPGKRTSRTVPAAPAKVQVDPKVLERYVGRYELAPNFFITVTREEGRLFVQATAQPRFEVDPISEREVYLEFVDARIAFSAEPDHALSLVLHQNGQDIPGKRVE